MYRVMIEGKDWIVRFFPPDIVEQSKKVLILNSLLRVSGKLSLLSHGEGFMILHKNIGAIIIKVETIPSQILTVDYIIEKDKWYPQGE